MQVTTRPSALEHDAFFYGSDARYVGVLGPLLEAAAARGDTCMAVVPERNAMLLDAAGVAGVRMVLADDWYRHPVRTIARYQDVLRSLPTGGRAFVIGEVAFGDTEQEWRTWTRYEAALNSALADHHAWIICPYDTRALPADVVADARRTHPHLLDEGGRGPSDCYLAPEHLVPSLAPVLDVPARPPDLEVAACDAVTVLRPALRSLVSAVRFGTDRVEELVLGLHEVVTNALSHGSGPVRLRMWWAAGEALWCVVEDAGPGCDDPLLGFRRPPPASEGGYGLWLARGLFDECELTRSELGGLAVTLVARTTAPH